MELILLALGILLGGFLVQLALLQCTKHKWKWLRFLSLAAPAGMCILAWVDYNSSAFFNDLAAFVDICVGFLILLGWGAAWVFYKKLLK